jgi:hypothetical protein
MITLLFSNIIFVCWYKTQVVANDNTFVKWLHFFPNTKKFLPLFCLLINFKCCKMLYSGFYGLESTMAKFGKSKSFYRVMRTPTYFQWIFCYLPIYVVDVIIFLKIEWGYQLLILGIETFVLQTLIIIMTWIEFSKGSQKLLEPQGE